MSPRLTGSSIAFAAILALAVPTHAQIDKRVNTGNQNSGRLRDANNQVGSGGVNLARPTYDLGGRADAIITGNVSGLGRFQGDSPLLQNNAFRSTLGTTALSDFQRSSVSLSDVLSGRTYAPGYFYDSQRTLPDADLVRRGLYGAGVSPQSVQRAALPRAGGVGDLPASLGLTDPRDRRIDGSATPSPLAGSQNRIYSNPAVANPPPARYPLYFDQAVNSSIFGPPAARGLADILAERRAARRDLIDRMANDLQRERLQREMALRDAGVAAPGAPDPAAAAPPVEIPPSIASIRVTGEPDPTAATGPGADRFGDMLAAIQSARQQGGAVTGFRDPARLRPAAAASESNGDTPSPEKRDPKISLGARGDRGHRADALKPDDAAVAALAGATRWAGDLNDPITTFAGARADEFNRHIAGGEEELRQGRYYNAAREFDLAATIDRRNPLPFLARGHALAAAGDYVSAVRSILSGVEIFPQIAAFRLDLNAMVGNSDVFDRRRADLERRLTLREDPELRFLLGYLELYSGLTDSAQKNLDAAAAHSPKDSPIARFPDRVFGRELVPVLNP